MYIILKFPTFIIFLQQNRQFYGCTMGTLTFGSFRRCARRIHVNNINMHSDAEGLYRVVQKRIPRLFLG